MRTKHSPNRSLQEESIEVGGEFEDQPPNFADISDIEQGQEPINISMSSELVQNKLKWSFPFIPFIITLIIIIVSNSINLISQQTSRFFMIDFISLLASLFLLIPYSTFRPCMWHLVVWISQSLFIMFIDVIIELKVICLGECVATVTVSSISAATAMQAKIHLTHKTNILFKILTISFLMTYKYARNIRALSLPWKSTEGNSRNSTIGNWVGSIEATMSSN